MCSKKELKQNMLRWVFHGGKLYPDWSQKLEGRSVYAHFDRDCIAGIYENPKVFKKVSEKEVFFAVEKGMIFKHIETLAVTSLRHFFSLGLKSGMLVKGQNRIAESVKKGMLLKYCFTAIDISARTFKDMEQIFKNRLKKTLITKEEFGNFADGRPVAVIAFKESTITEKSCFYINLVNKLRSGDIDAY